MKNHITKIVVEIIIVLFIINFEISAQTKEELEERKRKTLEDIEYTSTILQQTQKTRKTTVNKIQIINRRIQLRNDMINSVQEQIRMIEEEIYETDEIIEEMQKDLEKLKKEYATLIYYAYKSRNKYDKLMYLLSARNFNQAYKRMKYLQQYTRFRRKQAIEIVGIQEDLSEKISELEDKKQQKEQLVEEKLDENRILEEDKRQKTNLVRSLRTKENELREQIKEKRKIAERIEEEIRDIIAEETRKAREINLYKQLTPEEKLISDNFMGNKGRLPWPTERGIITSKFGRQEHPILKGITVQNNGIDITTVNGAEARALYDGVVSKVIAILGANYTVIIRHGNFLTVYQNLIDVKVKKGDQVKVKDTLGNVYTDADTNMTILHIEIWKELDKQNPEEWLSEK